MTDNTLIDVINTVIDTILPLIRPDISCLLLCITATKDSSYVEKYGADWQNHCCHGAGYHTGFIYKLFGIECLR